MSDTKLIKIKAPTASRLCRRFALQEVAQNLLRDDLTPAQFLELLIENEQYIDATRFLAHALPKREAVWWACLCTRSSLGEHPRPDVLAALKAAEQWVYEPTDENRRATMSAAEASGFEAPASWAAVAAFWSGDSLSPPDTPPVPPPENLTGNTVASAIMMATVVTEPQKAPQRYRTFLDQGIEIAKGGTGERSQPEPGKAATSR